MNTRHAEDHKGVPSPCIGVCVIDPSLTILESALCSGCFRTLDEIVRWSGADDDYRRAVWLKIEKRREELSE